MYNPKMIVLPIKKQFRPSLVNQSLPFNKGGSPRVTPRSKKVDGAHIVGRKIIVNKEKEGDEIQQGKETSKFE